MTVVSPTVMAARIGLTACPRVFDSSTGVCEHTSMALTSTTLLAACAPADKLLTLNSTAGVVKGALLGIESEIIQVAGLTGVGTQVLTLRGVNGTASAAHAAAVTVYVGVPTDFAAPVQDIVIAPSGSVLMGQGPSAPPLYSTAGGTLSLTNLTVSGDVGIGTTSPDAKLDVVKSALAVTSTDGIVLQNETASTAGVPVQMSPRLRLRSHVWNTTATAADNTQDWWIETQPTSAASPSGNLFFNRSLNGGATFSALQLTSSGTAYFGGGVFATQATTIGWNGSSRLVDVSNGKFNLTNEAQTAGVGLDVATDATLKIRTRAQTADAQLSAASVRGNAVAFASVPATPVEGMLVAITDSSTATWGATITGGGANHVLGYYNGTNWTVAGK